MKLPNLSANVCLVIAASLAFSTIAKAADLKISVSQTIDPRRDILLQFITQNQVTFDKFNLINEAKGDILLNDSIKLTANAKETANPNAGGYNNNTGAASTERGDYASNPNGLEVSGVKDPTMLEMATYLGNTNLNNIIDTEETGSFEMNLFFTYMIQEDQTGLDNLFVFERGKNSDLMVQAIDEKGNLIGNFLKLVHGQNQSDAGYQIDTTEIGGAQSVGGWGVSLKQLGVASAAGIRVRTESSFNGPDFKIIGRLGEDPILRRRELPEPTTIFGLGLVAGALVVSRLRQFGKTSSR